ncbi:MAG: hypothetical protein AVDCRST_MAG43-694, partial [uncultured Thermomicrobiales bacterium]
WMGANRQPLWLRKRIGHPKNGHERSEPRSRSDGTRRTMPRRSRYLCD